MMMIRSLILGLDEIYLYTLPLSNARTKPSFLMILLNFGPSKPTKWPQDRIFYKSALNLLKCIKILKFLNVKMLKLFKMMHLL